MQLQVKLQVRLPCGETLHMAPPHVMIENFLLNKISLEVKTSKGLNSESSKSLMHIQELRRASVDKALQTLAKPVIRFLLQLHRGRR